MPATEVYFYQEEDGSVPVLDWMNGFRRRNERAYRKCFQLIRLLESYGYDLHRPHADMLRDGVCELRTRVGRENYRILYGFVGKDVALLACGLTKERMVPAADIERAKLRIEAYKKAPDSHRFTYEEEEQGNGQN